MVFVGLQTIPLASSQQQLRNSLHHHLPPWLPTQQPGVDGLAAYKRTAPCSIPSSLSPPPPSVPTYSQLASLSLSFSVCHSPPSSSLFLPLSHILFPSLPLQYIFLITGKIWFFKGTSCMGPLGTPYSCCYHTIFHRSVNTVGSHYRAFFLGYKRQRTCIRQDKAGWLILSLLLRLHSVTLEHQLGSGEDLRVSQILWELVWMEQIT